MTVREKIMSLVRAGYEPREVPPELAHQHAPGTVKVEISRMRAAGDLPRLRYRKAGQ